MGKGGVFVKWACVACGCLAVNVVACSSDDEGGDTASGGSGGTAAAGGTGGTGGAPQGQPFVPEGITVEYVGQGPSGGLEIIAFTLVQEYGTLNSPAFIVAVRNTGTDPICYVDVPAAFLDGSGTELASTPGTGALSAPAYDSFGSPSPCLGTGDIGMGTITSGLSSLDVSQVTKIEHGFIGNIDPDATKISAVTIENVTIETTAVGTSVRATGTVRNGTTGSISDPDVAVFAVDPAGRPYAEMTDIELTTIAAGGSWTFQTLTYDGEVNEVVSYVAFDIP
jgi:hypothetical protein